MITDTSVNAEDGTKLKPDTSIVRSGTYNADPSQQYEHLSRLSDLSDLTEIDDLDAAVMEDDNEPSEKLSSDDNYTPSGVKTRASSWKWHLMELWVEFKLKTSQDAFVVKYTDKDKPVLLEATSKDAVLTQGQLTSYATAQLARQHRSFMFSLLICGNHARFIRWDRAGAIVSKHFDYHKKPGLLAQFIWRYGRLSELQRGFDPTVTPATVAEKEKFKTAIHDYLEDPQKRSVPDMEKSLDETYPCYKLTVNGMIDGKAETRECIIQKPSSYPRSPTGRCTRGYIALDLTTNELVFLKDYWRPADPDRPPESHIYAELEKAEVLHLPRIVLAGDVGIKDASGSQATLSQSWKGKAGMCACKETKEYRHHRIVQGLLFPLSTAVKSQELVGAVRDVIECELTFDFSLPSDETLISS